MVSAPWSCDFHGNQALEEEVLGRGKILYQAMSLGQSLTDGRLCGWQGAGAGEARQHTQQLYRAAGALPPEGRVIAAGPG